MLRLPPFDQIGAQPTPDFVNADPTNSVKGSIVNGLVFNQLQHEAENLELLAGLVPSGTDLTQWAQSVGRGLWLGQLGGTSDAIVGTLGTSIPSLLQGMRVRGVAAYANTTTTPTIRIYGIGSPTGYATFPILKADGTSVAAGDIVQGRRYEFEVDGSSPANVVITGGGIGTNTGGSTSVTQQITNSYTTNRVATNWQRKTNNTRAALSGQGTTFVNAMTVPTYTKVGAANVSNLVVIAEISGYTAQQGGAGATFQALTDGNSHTDYKYIAMDINLANVGAIAIKDTSVFYLTGIGAGSVNLTLQWSRQDNSTWYSIANPDGVDFGGSGSHTGYGATSTFTLFEIPV